MARPPAGADTLKVRMYKGLLGDCFLLSLASGAVRSHILIDCGILQGIAGGAQRMKKVAADIVAQTGGRLDLLVVTHQHWDHISGFAHAADVFLEGGIKIDRLWMGWTENGADPQAQALNARFDKAKRAVTAAARLAAQLKAQGAAVADSVTAGLEAFIGPIEDDERLAAAGGGRMTGARVMQTLKAVAGAVDFLEPGQVTRTPGPIGLKTYVLAPPRGENRLFKALPSKGDNQETYLAGDGLALADHILGVTDALEGLTDPDIPFSKRYRYAQAEVETLAADADGAARWLNAEYLQGPAWRRIDADWLGGAGALAMTLDSNTNNTSLVLAFETQGGKVLLFAADAQVGNWLSWHDQTYKTDGDEITVDALLARAVLYKVGHHASHNATLDAQGLELMTDPALAAMIPVVETDAHAQGGGWNMPFPPLLKRLMEKTGCRVLRGDSPAGQGPDNAPMTTDAAFLGRVRDAPNGLFVEYDLPSDAVGTFGPKGGHG
ncbi:MAG: hypothetical protein JWP92_1387 [Caulobacter sp.]|nr:hypothetical protein [Caulobacter sp.]